MKVANAEHSYRYLHRNKLKAKFVILDAVELEKAERACESKCSVT